MADTEAGSAPFFNRGFLLRGFRSPRTTTFRASHKHRLWALIPLSEHPLAAFLRLEPGPVWGSAGCFHAPPSTASQEEDTSSFVFLFPEFSGNLPGSLRPVFRLHLVPELTRPFPHAPGHSSPALPSLIQATMHHDPRRRGGQSRSVQAERTLLTVFSPNSRGTLSHCQRTHLASQLLHLGCVSA